MDKAPKANKPMATMALMPGYWAEFIKTPIMAPLLTTPMLPPTPIPTPRMVPVVLAARGTPLIKKSTEAPTTAVMAAETATTGIYTVLIAAPKAEA
ncbi:hypothetical protein RINTU1_13410 [Candidatus Regiella insecticola]|uniref:Uncharacterized protein n=1 Tax=Candidatus Regiella insecticola TaxID=138073 RepID=A0A6L2ZN23_9ENTR|nr:hypothetical protein RINTU1_13410 [Candidatus Regiella insecticola]